MNEQWLTDVLNAMRESPFDTHGPAELCRCLNIERHSDWCPVERPIHGWKVPKQSHDRMLRVLKALRRQGIVIHVMDGKNRRWKLQERVAECSK